MQGMATKNSFFSGQTTWVMIDRWWTMLMSEIWSLIGPIWWPFTLNRPNMNVEYVRQNAYFSTSNGDQSDNDGILILWWSDPYTAIKWVYFTAAAVKTRAIIDTVDLLSRINTAIEKIPIVLVSCSQMTTSCMSQPVSKTFLESSSTVHRATLT